MNEEWKMGPDVDLVVPMVFPQDAEWQREYERYVGGPAANAAGTVANARYRSWGTEELLVRCCMKYMPWLRCIHILLARESQVQPWMRALAGEPQGAAGEEGGGTAVGIDCREDAAKMHGERIAGEPQGAAGEEGGTAVGIDCREDAAKMHGERMAGEPQGAAGEGDGGMAGEPQGAGPQVRLVFHREFMPEAALPCFASPCIEMFLHRIPGLSEYFIYANDDMFPLSPLEMGDFFRRPTDPLPTSPVMGRGAGAVAGEKTHPRPLPSEGGERAVNTSDAGRKGVALPCQVMRDQPYPLSPNMFQRACQGGLNMVAKPFGQHFKATWLKNGHSFAPYLKSVCEEVWRRHGAEIMAHLSPLRRRGDSYNQYLYGYYQHLAGIVIDHAPREQYLGKSTPTKSIAAIIRDPQCGILCLNDNRAIKDWETRAEIVRREIAGKIGAKNGAAMTSQQTGQEGMTNEELRMKDEGMKNWKKGTENMGMNDEMKRHYEVNEALTIWVSYHKDELVQQHSLKEDGEHRLFATHRDVEGENINRLNPVYSEMVTMWWAWKNVVKSDVVGFEHYRRHLAVERPLPERGECQVFRVLDFGAKTVYQQYARWHNVKDMDVMLRLLDNRYGSGNPYRRHICESHQLIANCTFLMRWEDFTALCEYLFPLLKDFGRAMGMADGLGTVEQWHAKALRDFGGRRTEYQRRVVSFLAERLISAWIATHLRWQKVIDVAIVHYNTPELTTAAVRSIFKHTPNARVTIFDNSDKMPFDPKADALGTAAVGGTAAAKVTVIDNTRGQVVDFKKMLEEFPDKEMSDMDGSKFGSSKHCKSVEVLTELLPDGFVLMDSDVLVKKDITPLVNNNYAWVGQADIKRTRYGIRLPRVVPFICYLNVQMMKAHGIHYYNPEKMYALSMRKPDMGYDTGCWFHEAVSKANLPVRKVEIEEYIHHFGHASWKDRNPQEWLRIHRQLWL